MKLIIAGSRTITDIEFLINTLKYFTISKNSIKEIISGGANGVDFLGEYLAKHSEIKLVKFPADWDAYGRSAGYIRNKEMGNYGTALLAIQKDNSRGTQHMIDIMIKNNKKVFVCYVKEQLKRKLNKKVKVEEYVNIIKYKEYN